MEGVSEAFQIACAAARHGPLTGPAWIPTPYVPTLGRRPSQALIEAAIRNKRCPNASRREMAAVLAQDGSVGTKHPCPMTPGALDGLEATVEHLASFSGPRCS